MLNFRRQERPLTQGQPLGQRVLARAVAVEDAPAPAEAVSPESQPAPEATAAPAAVASPNPRAVAERVYELMRRDLQVERERRGFYR